jgi:hypothetical protein
MPEKKKYRALGGTGNEQIQMLEKRSNTAEVVTGLLRGSAI